jgi:catechol 2,3-dioxygenase-like lactoylglutathione lyase family enzyme
MSTKLYRIILPVLDIDEAERFYTAALGLNGHRVSNGRHYFDCGGVILACYDPRADGDDFSARPNQEHLYFAVDDLEAAFERVEKLGALSREIGDGGLPMGEIVTRPWGERCFYAVDPFGNPICFVDEKTLFTGQ